MKVKTQLSKACGIQFSSSKREVYSNAILPQEEETSNNNLTSHPKELKKEQTNLKLVKGKNSQRSEQK